MEKEAFILAHLPLILAAHIPGAGGSRRSHEGSRVYDQPPTEPFDLDSILLPCIPTSSISDSSENASMPFTSGGDNTNKTNTKKHTAPELSDKSVMQMVLRMGQSSGMTTYTLPDWINWTETEGGGHIISTPLLDQHLAHLASRSVYLEFHGPPKQTPLTLGEFRTSILKNSSPNAMVHGTPVTDIIQSYISFASYSFVLLDTAEHAAQAIASQPPFSFLTPSSPELSYTTAIKRCMLLSTWRTRSLEYQTLLAQRQLAHALILKSRLHSGTLTYTPGVIAQFTGVHPYTSGRVLKQLFGMIAHISFVEWHVGGTTGNKGKGYVRFHTPHGARLAECYFSRNRVLQRHAQCTGVLESVNSGSAWPGILVRLLKGEEEDTYWQRIKSTSITPSGGNTSNPSNTGAGGSSAMSSKTHIIFEDEDDEDDEDVFVGGGKRRPHKPAPQPKRPHLSTD